MLRKIADIKPPCMHSEHNPPSMIVLPPGLYEHICPGCGQKSTFHVAGNYCTSQDGRAVANVVGTARITTYGD